VQHEWQGATLEELLRVQLAPFGGLDGARFAARGPEVYLRPQAMQSLGLILHELATNATKHGALSSPAGAIAIDWTGEADGVRLTWRNAAARRSQRPSARVRTGRVSSGSERRWREISQPNSAPRASSAPSTSARKPARAGLVRGVRQPLRPFPKARQDNLVILFQ